MKDHIVIIVVLHLHKKEKTLDLSVTILLDKNNIQIEADNIKYGISCIKSAVVQAVESCYPPTPTPNNELALNIGEFVIVVNL